MSYELHKKLLSVAEKHGLTLERRLEMTGVCASQMALSLLGGPNRYGRCLWGEGGALSGHCCQRASFWLLWCLCLVLKSGVRHG